MVAVESVGTLSGSEIERDIKNSGFYNAFALREAKNPTKVGFITTDIRKIKYEQVTKGLLDANRLRFCNQLACGNPFISIPAERQKQARTTLETELRNMRHVVKQLLLTGKTRVIVSGKCDSSGRFTGQQQDDLAMATMMGIYWFGKWDINSRGRDPTLLIEDYAEPAISMSGQIFGHNGYQWDKKRKNMF